MSNNRNFIAKRKKNLSKDFQTMFNIGVSSRALFGLSPNALKLYMMFVLNGKKTEPSIARFSKMTGMSPRTVSRYYEELKEKNFLKITSLGINKYKYEFDPFGNLNIPYKKKKVEEPIVKEPTYVEKEIEQPIEEKEVATTKEVNEFVEKAKVIQEYEDFAVLENYYWTLKEDAQKEIIKILKDRFNKEPSNKEPIEWFLNKVI